MLTHTKKLFTSCKKSNLCRLVMCHQNRETATRSSIFALYVYTDNKPVCCYYTTIPWFGVSTDNIPLCIYATYTIKCMPLYTMSIFMTEHSRCCTTAKIILNSTSSECIQLLCDAPPPLLCSAVKYVPKFLVCTTAPQVRSGLHHCTSLLVFVIVMLRHIV